MSDRTVTVTIRTEGAAFRGDRHDETDDTLNREEVANLLRVAAERIEAGSNGGILTDYNGNSVGRVDVDERG
jgi:hypothetical protein